MGKKAKETKGHTHTHTQTHREREGGREKDENDSARMFVNDTNINKT